ncbi:MULTISPECIES: heme o synthase [Haloarcula]|uniref:Protoheme IX farnesyltransferase n=1 Tax=Haloarcula pellucida TaxID=1427151 RepID=A0A830GJG1_9EURY|nr:MULTISPECIES: heme o synthase [Halomicroarcula]MBX0347076.1 heme o synthase [Halomicroarcula pellucida]MDS0277049.1 heme o synthase [Halomicroarcula sp. S1AR25-4]GGN86874.1 protoheme IX farnesyltransferase [Halomicroarcula pellucida]
MAERRAFSGLLAATAVGVYLLVIAGATAAITDAVTACTTWPLCQGPVTLENPDLLIARGHRLTAAAVGVLTLVTVGVGLRTATRRRVKAALVTGLALYPVQVALGAFVATTGAAGQLPSAHLATGMAIFTSFVLALAWHLEAETGSDDDERVANPEPDPMPGDGGEPTPTPTLSGRDRVVATVGAYFRLMKPRLMWLLCLVAGAGMALAADPALTSGSGLTVRTVVLTLGGGVLAIGASGTFNHVLERDIDKRMDRTSDRPIATHQIPVRNALTFGVGLALAALALFWQVNVLAAALGLSAILFYSVVYTLVLKPNTVQNTVLGGAAGALPALIGWAAVDGTIGLPGLALAGVIFLWTPAHFYNLALAYKDDYEAGGFPMMPVVRGETETRKHIVYYLGATLVASGVLASLTSLGWLYALTSAALGAVFLWAVVELHRKQTEAAAFRAFHASNAYLGMLLLAIVVDALVL